MQVLKMKKSKQLERHLKGLANHRRLDILVFVKKFPGATLDGIAAKIDCHLANVSIHTHKLVKAGLLDKKYVGREVSHVLSPYGEKFLSFLETI